GYFRGHVSKLSNRQLVMTVFDQLNPAYAKYYTKAEAIDLLRSAGFSNIEIHHRHGYSWTIVGERVI
ncbi:MAG: class I SAM-dependent methyltransferase, partial [Planctomyces sp.]